MHHGRTKDVRAEKNKAEDMKKTLRWTIIKIVLTPTRNTFSYKNKKVFKAS